jgi:hypothetical protein
MSFSVVKGEYDYIDFGNGNVANLGLINVSATRSILGVTSRLNCDGMQTNSDEFFLGWRHLESVRHMLVAD